MNLSSEVDNLIFLYSVKSRYLCLLLKQIFENTIAGRSIAVPKGREESPGNTGNRAS